MLSRVLIYFLLRLAVRRLRDRVNYKLEVTIARQELPQLLVKLDNIYRMISLIFSSQVQHGNIFLYTCKRILHIEE